MEPIEMPTTLDQAGDGFIDYLRESNVSGIDMTILRQTSAYVYIASPYSHPEALIREERYLRASFYLMQKLKRREWAYSPIVHCHELAKIWGMPGDAKFWEEYDFAMIRGARAIEVLRLDGWQESVGVKAEIEYATSIGVPITYV